MLNTHELEQLFASDNSSPIFPILASNYYDKKLYKYAVKVCKIGLHSDPDNLEGLYILAKSLLMSGEEKNAAILLKKILKQFPYHLQSALLLIHVLEETNQNKSFIKNQIRQIFYFYPNHPQVKLFYEKYGLVSSHTKKKKAKTKPSIASNKHFSYNPKLATITMYQLLYSQNKFDDALSVLSILADSQRHQKFVNKELKKIKQKLK